MEEVKLFISFVEAHRYIGYLILFFSMLIEGELFLLAAGILSNLGAFDFFDVLIIAIAGVLFSDIVWYWLGRFFQNKYPNQVVIKFFERRVRKVFPSIRDNPFKLVFISKFLYGFNHSTIFILGFLKTEFWHFFKVQVQASVLWVAIFLSLGYFFGYTAIHVSKKINKLVLVFLIIFILFLIFEKTVDYLVAKKISTKNNLKNIV